MSRAGQRWMIAAAVVALLLVGLWRWLRPTAPPPVAQPGSRERATGEGRAADRRGPPSRPQRAAAPRRAGAGAAGRPSAPSGAERPQRGTPAPPLAAAAAVDVDRSAERADELAQHGDYARALVEADRCLAVDPQRDGCVAVARFSAARTGDFERAYPMLQDCLAADPDNVECLSGMVPTQLWRGELAAARAAATKLAQIDPDGHWTHLALGQVHEDAGELEAARSELEQACTQGHDYGCRRAAALGGEERIR